MAQNKRTQTRLDVKTPALAYVGAVDLAVEAVRDYVTELNTRVAAARADLGKQFASFEPKDARAAVNTRVEALSKDAQARRAAIEARVAELQAQGKELPGKVQASATDTYNDLAKRGDALVKRIRNQQSTKEAVKDAKTTVAKAKATRTTAQKTAAAKKAAQKRAATVQKTAAQKAAATRRNSGKKAAAATRSNAKATVTAATKTAEAAAKAVVEAAEKVGD